MVRGVWREHWIGAPWCRQTPISRCCFSGLSLFLLPYNISLGFARRKLDFHFLLESTFFSFVFWNTILWLPLSQMETFEHSRIMCFGTPFCLPLNQTETFKHSRIMFYPVKYGNPRLSVYNYSYYLKQYLPTCLQ